MYETTQNGQIYLFKSKRHHITRNMKLITASPQKNVFLNLLKTSGSWTKTVIPK